MSATLSIDPRFCGPDGSANGGYTCGLLARGLRGPVEVTLRQPPPLGRALRVEDGATRRLLDGPSVVAVAQAAALSLDVPPAPSFEEAETLASSYAGLRDHRFPRCFVCGTARSDGLGLRPGRRADGIAAAAWVPDASLARDDGLVAPEFLWAALDCPGFWGAAAPDLPVAVLGRMTGEVEPGPKAGDRCVVIGWGRAAREGRKIQAATALFDAGGRLRGRSIQTWIVL